MTSSRPPVAAAQRPPVRRRPWWEVRWRQFRNAPRPVFRAVASSLSVAIALGVIYLVYDVALSRGADLPGGDLRTAAVAVYVVIVLVAGTVITYLVVPQPRRGAAAGAGAGGGAGGGANAAGRMGSGRSGWSAALGFFAAVPIAYIVLVVVVQVLKPLLT